MTVQKASTRRRPGRPKHQDAGAPETRDAILDVAERIFAERGYEGTKMRDIAERANVNQALIRYYFGPKQDLFDQVFRRRGAIISGRRHVLLDELEDADAPASVEQIIRAYLTPQWEMKYSGPGGEAFVRLQARLHSEPEEHAMRLRREVYDASAKRYIEALSRALPDIPHTEISVRMAYLIGTYLFMLNDLGRLNDLTDNQIGEIPPARMLESLVGFLAAGMQAPPP